MLSRLESSYSKFELSHRMNVVPMGSRLRALGVASFCQIHPDVRLIVSTPKPYDAARCMSGCREMWTISVPSTRVLRTALSRVGRFEVV